jgi:hypothetical protein
LSGFLGFGGCQQRHQSDASRTELRRERLRPPQGSSLESLSGMGETPRLQAKPSGGLRYDGGRCANCGGPPIPSIVCTTTSSSPRSIASRC